MKKGLVNVLFANILFMILNFLINFLIPKYVSIDTYSLIKTYTLYIGYAGFLHFGYNDGMYLKYGGKKIENIDKNDLGNNFYNYIILNLFMFSITLIVSLLLKDSIIFAFAFGMVACNVMNYLKSLYQATGKFKLYGICLNVDRICVFILTILALFVLKSDNYLIFIWIQVGVSILSTLILFLNLEKKLRFIRYGKFKLSEYTSNIKSGFVLMLGNFSSLFFTSMDRWFVKILLSSFDFAMYSFAAGMESIISVFISPITVTMYNYFCKKPSDESIIKVKKITTIYGFFILLTAFVAKFILEVFLVTYTSASKIIFLLFGAQLFIVTINGIYVNLYKARKKQKLYFIQMVCMITIGAILNYVFFKIYGNTTAIAMATFITSIIWFIVCELIDRKYAFNLKEYIAIILVIVVYLLTVFMLNALVGMFIYIVFMAAICLIFMRSTTIYLIDLVKSKSVEFINAFKQKFTRKRSSNN